MTINAISDSLMNEEHRISMNIYYDGGMKILRKINFIVKVDLPVKVDPTGHDARAELFKTLAEEIKSKQVD